VAWPLPQPAGVKACPTCGREVEDGVGVCDSCEAWASALVQARPDVDTARISEAPVTESLVPVAAAKAAPASHRRLTLIAAGVAVVALTGFAISSRGGSASDPSGPVAAPAAEVRTAPPATPVPTTAPAVQTWSTERHATSLGNHRRGATFELASENVVKTWFGPARASLVVRCTARRLEAFVVTGSPMKIDPKVDGRTVTIRVDGEPVRTQQWIDSDDHTAVFAPDAAAFVQRLRTARTFDFGYSPHNSSDVVVQFSVLGIDGLIGAASKECGAV
jgi:hypothetical protein